ncbi:hypothetical protein DXD93_08630 [Ruminococcus bromii]|jgi:hypothetical protein|nr:MULTISPECIES: hypothetical protein [Ruminococcus]RGH57956.1 hypothetical protein DW824_08660 [Ruminococcus sp. AM34-10LB]RGI07590.1 hypothetical protein DXD22_08630 [Ruminococcus sp. TF12-19AC]RGI69880.1 hypothetical protein DXD93_08630 [Ruminococcus bromii]
MKQKYYVIDAMRANGGYATLQQLNMLVDFSTWKTKTPEASIRRIVQENDEFFRIQPGLWALREYENEVNKKFNIIKSNVESVSQFTHSYYQGIIVEIGNIKKLGTYVPPQDKNKLFLEKKLSDIITVHDIYKFTYDDIIRNAKTVDAIWFNERKMPCAFYEVEHTTNIKNSLNKFFELQDFRAKFYIVADKARKRQFEDVIGASIYNPIREMVGFVSYDDLVKQYSNESKIKRVI